MVIAVLALVLGCARIARADDEAARAQSRTLFTSGATALDDGRPGEALAFFQRAYALYPHYATLYNIGLCQRALGRTVDSVTAFLKFLDVGGDGVPPEQRSTATRLIKEGQAKIVLATIKMTPASAKVTIDGKPLEGREVLLDPGPHMLDATAAGRQPVHHAFTSEPGARPVITLTMPREDEPVTTAPVVDEPPIVERHAPPPPPGPVPGEPPRSRFTSTFWIASGVAAAALVTTGITGGLALADSSAYNDPKTSDADAASRKSRGETLRVVADVSLGVAVVGAIVAIVAVTQAPDPAATPAPAKSVTLMPGTTLRGGSLDLRVRF